MTLTKSKLAVALAVIVCQVTFAESYDEYGYKLHRYTTSSGKDILQLYNKNLDKVSDVHPERFYDLPDVETVDKAFHRENPALSIMYHFDKTNPHCFDSASLVNNNYKGSDFSIHEKKCFFNISNSNEWKFSGGDYQCSIYGIDKSDMAMMMIGPLTTRKKTITNQGLYDLLMETPLTSEFQLYGFPNIQTRFSMKNVSKVRKSIESYCSDK